MRGFADVYRAVHGNESVLFVREELYTVQVMEMNLSCLWLRGWDCSCVQCSSWQWICPVCGWEAIDCSCVQCSSWQWSGLVCWWHASLKLCTVQSMASLSRLRLRGFVVEALSPCHRRHSCVVMASSSLLRHRVFVTGMASWLRGFSSATSSPWLCLRAFAVMASSPSFCRRDFVAEFSSPWLRRRVVVVTLSLSLTQMQ